MARTRTKAAAVSGQPKTQLKKQAKKKRLATVKEVKVAAKIKRVARRPKRSTRTSASPVSVAPTIPVVPIEPSAAHHEPSHEPWTTSPAPVLEPRYKALADRGTRSKLWLAVAASSAVIVVVWLYFIQQTWLTVPNDVSATIKNSNVQQLVSHIEDQLGELQTTAADLINQQKQIETQYASPTTAPTTEELNTLFSDLQ